MFFILLVGKIGFLYSINLSFIGLFFAYNLFLLLIALFVPLLFLLCLLKEWGKLGFSRLGL
jgi:hypothetical protein